MYAKDDLVYWLADICLVVQEEWVLAFSDFVGKKVHQLGLIFDPILFDQSYYSFLYNNITHNILDQSSSMIRIVLYYYFWMVLFESSYIAI